ncbi:hypothetical protein [Terracidiphilus sp.]|uniref:hypothetical protein n=1 Tax=Terracidiphilus sp. TaxID=1964191 RepID=UPI003C1703AA
MRNVSFCWVFFFVFAVALGCQTPSPDWNGLWKLNPAKSSFQDPILTILITADDEYRFDESSSHTLHCDGQDRSIGNNRMLTCVKSSATVLDIALKENGVKTRATRDELSTDGKIFTTTVTEFRPNASAFTHQIVFSRLSGANGFAGQWRDTSYIQEYADMTLKLDNQALRIDYPNSGRHIDALLNGVEAETRWSQAPEGATRTVWPAGGREFAVVMKRHDKDFTQGSMKLSDDGKVITYSLWNSDKPDSKTTFVYEKK